MKAEFIWLKQKKKKTALLWNIYIKKKKGFNFNIL